MEVRISPDKQARLQHFADRSGKNAAQPVEETADRMLEYDSRFIEAVEIGREFAHRGELLEHDEVVEKIERILSARMRVRWTTRAADDLAGIVDPQG